MKLGQHFLVNKNKLRKIVEALDLKAGDVVIEIGPGHGELTQFLVDELLAFREYSLIIIEKDKGLVRYLKNKFQIPNVQIIEGDILKALPELTKSYKLKTKNYKVVGNIPYYITGYLFRIIGELKNKPALIVCTVQKEVAERICAKPPKMNLLAASVQFWAEPKIIGRISKKDFRPVPKVDSAIIKLTTDYRPQTTANKAVVRSPLAVDSDKYYRFIKILFKQPRKTIWNNLRPINKDQKSRRKVGTPTKASGLITKKLESLGINPQDRPQDLNIEQIRQLSTLFRGLL